MKQQPNPAQTGIFRGRVEVPYAYGCFGWTRGGGSTWHGGIDLVGAEDTAIRMPFYREKDGTLRPIRGRVVTARIVTDHSNPTWEWGYYVCVKLDAAQTPDAVNYLYFCHCSRLLVQAGAVVESGDALAVMGNSGNAALNDSPYAHCHLEVRPTATGTGLDPTAYSGTANAPGTYGPDPAAPGGQAPARLQVITIGPVSQGDADAILAVCRQRGLDSQGLYTSQWA